MALMVSVVTALSGARSAAGQGALGESRVRFCEGVRVYVAPDLAPEWADAASDLRAHVPPPQTTCAAVILRLDPIPRGARLSAMAHDGRYAERAVVRPSALTAGIAVGLLTSIPA